MSGVAAPHDRSIVFSGVSKYYGEVLGVNHVDLLIEPGITSLVGPNGSGKTTLMNLMTGLLQPTSGSVSVLGVSPQQPEELFTKVGYCTQYDYFPRGLTGFTFLYHFARLHGFDDKTSRRVAEEGLEKLGLVEHARRPIAAYSKGMRQRIKLAQAICHRPAVLVLDEPLNGLDPMARAEMIAMFKDLADQGLHIIISSHILHEVDMVSDCVVLLSHGYVVAAGSIEGVRGEVTGHPMQIMVRCDRPQLLASRAVSQDTVMEVQIHDDRQGLHIRTRDPDRFYGLLAQAVAARELRLESVGPADEDVHAVYRYVIQNDEEIS